ncbi:type IV toxin-antitoxin system AbiEi family antitoxin domain-containing protein [Sinomonas sp. JGH33]|uniref:Type IV toxin-antitoxin system AbiEi family antitoxin domain-containing protein n=1 Tax=Sinomonas terricola TaxID=3110330 RepID=A0ABU5T1C1_9MICC|nr:type IV toxin-antitoxin system AbiEi family antitoxin domain-containing protein [Sinomonas sp. JGH33]MEA5453451.1 type IV toxin-antitoxin system AbiEi family antitoxin domain-containing protein [Sinomonas sp. JGH33]
MKITDAFLRVLQARDGVARTGELLSAGVTKYALSEAVAAGRALRPSRGVIALPDADPLMIRCVSTNSLLTCASAARRHGLWLLHEPERIHVARADGRLQSLMLNWTARRTTNPRAWQKDYVRDAAAQALGFATVRFAYADVVHRPDEMVGRVREVVAKRLSLGQLPRY